jgi:hypothetical protein
MVHFTRPFFSVFCLCLMVFWGQRVIAQEPGMEGIDSPDVIAEVDSSHNGWRDRLRVSGYVKYLQSSFLAWDAFGGVPAPLLNQFLGNAIHDHLIHHRLNVSYQFSPALSLQMGWRNRLFYGDQPRLYSLTGGDYGKTVDQDANDVLDLSFLPLNKQSWVIHSILDRAFLEWRGKRDEIRVGRQRVNWGVATLWNPNDVLNAYSFIDFDYEERPGTDALRWIHYFNDARSTELAIRPADSLAGLTVAGLYKGYFRSINYQLLAAWHQEDLALGIGWETDLGPAAWKWESTVFIPSGKQDARSTVLALSTDWMRTWQNGFLLGAGYLLNTGANSNGNLFADFNERLSARNLYPFRHNLFLQGSYPVTPLLTTSLAAVYSPGKSNALFISPVMTYSVATNWDLDLTGQILVQDDGSAWNSPIQAFFLRLRWSY